MLKKFVWIFVFAISHIACSMDTVLYRGAAVRSAPGNELSRELLEKHAENPTDALFKYVQESDDPSGAEHLIAAGANVKARELIHTAAEYNRPLFIIRMVASLPESERSDVLESRNSIGETPLLAAASLGRSEAVDSLIVLGARVDVVDDDGTSYADYVASLVSASATGVTFSVDDDKENFI